MYSESGAIPNKGGEKEVWGFNRVPTNRKQVEQPIHGNIKATELLFDRAYGRIIVLCLSFYSCTITERGKLIVDLYQLFRGILILGILILAHLQKLIIIHSV